MGDITKEVTDISKVTSGGTGSEDKSANLEDLNIGNLEGVLKNNQRIINKPEEVAEKEEEKRKKEEAAEKASKLTDQQVTDKRTEIKAKEEST